jgi:SAM-dependent methyltransferase
MSDDSGLPRPGPRRRTTRRLLRHAARVVAQEATANPTATASSGTAAEAFPAARAGDTGDAGAGVEATQKPAAAPNLPVAQLLAALSAVTEAGGQVANNHEQPAMADTSGAQPGALGAVSLAIADSDRPQAHDAQRSDVDNDAEIKTKPKIRVPDAVRRQSPRPVPPPPAAALTANAATGSTLSSGPAAPIGPVHVPVPSPPELGGSVESAQIQPTGEGIIRASQPAPRMATPAGRPKTDSDLPTRPRIPLTDDMALAAGRLTSLDVARVALNDDPETSPRISISPDADAEEVAPAVIVTRARMITDAPPPPLDESSVVHEPLRLRPSRRIRPDSEEFETLDIEVGEVDAALRDAIDSVGQGRVGDGGARAGRTPPPPPGQAHAKRGATASAQRPAPPAPPPPPPGAGKKPASAPKPKSKKRPWWEVLFSDDYVRTLPRPEPALVAKQVSFMEESLGVSRGDALLDVGCGLGQHALEFARRGYLVVALDLALSMITRAAEAAQQQNLRINFLHKDIRDIGFEGTFDAVVCVGTTFGFFDDEQNRGVLQRLGHALKPGGRLLLDVVNRDHVLSSQPNLVWFEGDGCVVMEESDFNFYSSRLSVKRTMMQEDGRQTESEYSVRLYSLHELGQLLKQSGFTIKEVSGQEATRGLFFGANSGRIIMLAERRTSARTPSTPPDPDFR